MDAYQGIFALTSGAAVRLHASCDSATHKMYETRCPTFFVRAALGGPSGCLLQRPLPGNPTDSSLPSHIQLPPPPSGRAKPGARVGWLAELGGVWGAWQAGCLRCVRARGLARDHKWCGWRRWWRAGGVLAVRGGHTRQRRIGMVALVMFSSWRLVGVRVRRQMARSHFG